MTPQRARRTHEDLDLRVSVGYFTHWKTRALVKAHGQKAAYAQLALWAYLRVRSPSAGSLAGLSDDEIAAACDLEDVSVEDWLKTLVRVRYLDSIDGVLHVHEWAQHQEYAANADWRIDRARRAAEKRWHRDQDEPPAAPPAAPAPPPRPPKADASSMLPLSSKDAPASQPALKKTEGAQAPPAPRPGRPAGGTVPHPLELLDVWNTHRGTLPSARSIIGSTTRDKRARAALHGEPDLRVWASAVRALATSGWHQGNNKSGWKADLDFLLQPDQLNKWLDAGRELLANETKKKRDPHGA